MKKESLKRNNFHKHCCMLFETLKGGYVIFIFWACSSSCKQNCFLAVLILYTRLCKPSSFNRCRWRKLRLFTNHISWGQPCYLLIFVVPKNILNSELWIDRFILQFDYWWYLLDSNTNWRKWGKPLDHSGVT